MANEVDPVRLAALELAIGWVGASLSAAEIVYVATRFERYLTGAAPIEVEP